jgi:hypothetical protein
MEMAEEFDSVDMRIGTVLKAKKDKKKASYNVEVNFEGLGVQKGSLPGKKRKLKDLIGKKVLAAVSFLQPSPEVKLFGII